MFPSMKVARQLALAVSRPRQNQHRQLSLVSQKETSDERNPGRDRAQRTCGEQKGGSYAAGFVHRYLTLVCFALPLGQPHNRCESAPGLGNNTITLLSLRSAAGLARQELKLVVSHWLLFPSYAASRHESCMLLPS